MRNRAFRPALDRFEHRATPSGVFAGTAFGGPVPQVVTGNITSQGTGALVINGHDYGDYGFGTTLIYKGHDQAGDMYSGTISISGTALTIDVSGEFTAFGTYHPSRLSAGELYESGWFTYADVSGSEAGATGQVLITFVPHEPGTTGGLFASF